MPPLPAIDSVLRYDWLFTVGEDLGASVRQFWAYTGTPPNNATCTDLAAGAYDSFVAGPLLWMHPDNAVTGLSVTDLSSSTSGQGAVAVTTPGLGSGDPLPAEVCLLINQEFHRRYRGGKSRAYWPLGTASYVSTPGVWNPTVLAEMLAAIVAMNAAIVADPVAGCNPSEQVSVSYYKGFVAVTNPITGRTRDVPTVRSSAIAPDVIESLVANPKFGSQRRRQLHSS